ncbi:hypothetical protein ACAW74_21975 [Fibrella sp. WM1]|uniref:hypothetical protein n=1 Tax=Fibrella musci TaxID=3242485 RepID=UPI003520CBE3
MLDRLLSQIDKYPFDFISHFFLLLPVLFCVIRREFLDKILLCVGLYFFIRFLEESVLLYYVLHKKSTISLQKGLLAIDTLIVAELFYLALKQRYVARQVGISLALITVFITIITYIYSQYSFINASLFRALIIFFAIAYFNKILAENRVLRIVNHAMFWVSAGFLIYGMGTFMTSLFTDYLLDPTITSDQTFDLFWNMSQFLSVIQCVLVSIGLWVSKFDRENYIQPI